MNIVYLIKFDRNIFPNKYIGSKSNCKVIDNKIIDSRGKEYRGSSSDRIFKQLMESGFQYTIQVLATYEDYTDTLLAERDIQLKYDVVANIEFFNKAIATFSSFTDPNYATYKHIDTGKCVRLPRDHPKVLSGEYVGVSKGTILTEEERKKRGRSGSENGFYGKKHTDKTKAICAKKIGDAHRGKPKTDEQKRRMSEARKLWWINRKKNSESGKEESV